AGPVDLLIARELAAVLLLSNRTPPLRMYTPVSERLVVDVRTEQHLAELVDAFHLTLDRIGLEVPRTLLLASGSSVRDALGYLHEVGAARAIVGARTAGDVGLAADYGCRDVFLARDIDVASVTSIVA